MSQHQEMLDPMMSEITLTDRLGEIEKALTPEDIAGARQYIEELRAASIKSVEGLLTAVADTNTEVRLRVIGCLLLGLLGDAQAATALSRAFVDAEDKGLMWEAARTLAQLHAIQVTPVIIDVLTLGSPPKQTAAAWLLGWLGVASAIPPLRAASAKRALPIEVRAHAIEALGVIRAQEAVPDLVSMLSDESAELRYWAVYALGQIADSQSIPALEEVAANDTGSLAHGRSVRQEALDALDSIRRQQQG